MAESRVSMDLSGAVNECVLTIRGAGSLRVVAGGGMMQVRWVTDPDAVTGPLRAVVRRGTNAMTLLADELTMDGSIPYQAPEVSKALVGPETVTERLALLRDGGVNESVTRRGVKTVAMRQPVPDGKWVVIALDGVVSGAWLAAFDLISEANNWATDNDYTVDEGT